MVGKSIAFVEFMYEKFKMVRKIQNGTTVLTFFIKKLYIMASSSTKKYGKGTAFLKRDRDFFF